jgi:DNA-nicking Smr family endonuclease
MRRKPGRGRNPDASELALWRHVTRGIRPLRPVEIDGPAEPANAAPAEPVAKPSATRPFLKTVAVRPVPPQALGAVNGATERRLRQGRLEPEASLDLHGLTQAQAHRALSAFLDRSLASGLRVLLVVTGKGSRSGGGASDDSLWMQRPGGTLKGLVPAWLEQGAHASRIAAIRTAHPRHGGAGAIYVYLRTKSR